MKFHYQLNGHYPPNGIVGDCYRTAIACMLNKRPQEVPHFLEKYLDNGQLPESIPELDKDVNDWLATQGLSKLDIPFPGPDLENVLDTMAHVNGEDLLYLLNGYSRTNCGHVVVCRGRNIIWDPSPTQSGIVGPMKDGNFWLTFFTPAFARYTPLPVPIADLT